MSDLSPVLSLAEAASLLGTTARALVGAGVSYQCETYGEDSVEFDFDLLEDEPLPEHDAFEEFLASLDSGDE